MRHTATRLAVLALLALAALAPAAALAQPTGVLFVVNNKVGIGTSTPTDPLHVKKSTAGAAVIARLTNNGSPFLAYENTAIGVTWGVNPGGTGNMTITKFGTGGAEFEIFGNGRVLMGPGPVTNFDLDPVGNLTIQGTLTQSSSRAAKEGFAALDRREMLERVTALEVPEWSYREQSARHVGPIAEDFHAAFGLGSGNAHLAPSDVAGVTLVALQGLHDAMREQDREKDRRIEELTRELAELRALVETLAAR